MSLCWARIGNPEKKGLQMRPSRGLDYRAKLSRVQPKDQGDLIFLQTVVPLTSPPDHGDFQSQLLSNTK